VHALHAATIAIYFAEHEELMHASTPLGTTIGATVCRGNTFARCTIAFHSLSLWICSMVRYGVLAFTLIVLTAATNIPLRRLHVSTFAKLRLLQLYCKVACCSYIGTGCSVQPICCPSHFIRQEPSCNMHCLLSLHLIHRYIEHSCPYRLLFTA
jgi:hypothetical protein